ncbi:MAG: hypothetical protein KTR30_23150 [Saprospiraceae bacterium]|nr:hypothetical protein [Saprospiraceae bacterium]
MEEWELEFEWLRIRHFIQKRFGKGQLPDLNAILFIIGIQELGRWQATFTKEEKQDLMHIAICRLLSYQGYYAFKGRDADGWPHWEVLKPVKAQGLENQESLLKENVIRYFKEWEVENGALEEE